MPVETAPIIPTTEKPLVSVITVVRNGAAHIADNLASVAEQDYPAIEHLVLDGASTDGTQELVRVRAHPRLRFTSEPDDGIYHAMNKGIAQAKGVYMVFLNSDDTFASSQAVSLAMARLSGDATNLSEESLHCFAYAPFSRTSPMPALIARPQVHVRDPLSVHTICHQGTIFPRQVFARVGTYDEGFRLAGDFEHRLRCHLAGISFVCHPVVLVRFCLDGATERQMARSFAESEHAVRASCGAWAGWRFRALFWRARLRKMLGAMAKTILGGGAYAWLRSWSLRRRHG